MQKRLRNILTLALLLITAMTQAESYTTEGKTFWLSFMGLTDGVVTTTDAGETELFVLVASKKGCKGFIQNPATGWSRQFNVEAGEVTKITVPQKEAYCNAGGGDTVAIFDKGLILTTSDTASVYAGNYLPYSFDATAVLPIQSTGTDYKVACYNSNTQAMFIAVATEDSTKLEITFTAEIEPNDTTKYKADTTYTFELMRGQTFMAAGTGIIGTRVKSANCKPIALFSGNYCPFVPSSCPACDVLVEQIPPLKAWGKKFIISPTVKRSRDSRVVVQPKETETSVHINIEKTLDTTITIAANKYAEFELGQYQATVEAEAPVAVTQYAIGGMCSGLGDPFMVWINPVEQAVKKTVFTPCPSSHINNHYVQIIVPTAAVPLTTLDDKSIAEKFSPTGVNKDYSSARILVSPTPHTLTNDSGLMAYVYGYADMSSSDYSYESYGYFAGTSVNNMEDRAQVPDEVHQYTENDRITITRKIESEFINVEWMLNGKKLDIDKSPEPEYTIEIATAEFTDGKNTLDMLINRSCKTDTITYTFHFTICPPIEIPRFFTPNDDGENDHFVVNHLDCYEKASVRIYDRYGKLLTKYPSSINSWDGKHNGNPVSTDSYWYEVSVPELGKKYVNYFLLKR